VANIFQRFGEEGNQFFVKGTGELRLSAEYGEIEKSAYLCRGIGSVDDSYVVVFAVLQVADELFA
jgi:hypothetical protein